MILQREVRRGTSWRTIPYELRAEEVAPHVRAMHDVMVVAGEGNKKIWVTEIGDQAQTPAVTDSGVIPLAPDEERKRCFSRASIPISGTCARSWSAFSGSSMRTSSLLNRTSKRAMVSSGFKRDGDTPGAPWPRKEAMRAYAALARPAALPTSPEDANKPTASDARYFPETKHWIAGPFRLYWERNGGRERFGMPRTSVFTTAGVVVQIFERARFEFRKENAGKPNEVELGLLGRITTQDRTFPTAIARYWIPT